MLAGEDIAVPDTAPAITEEHVTELVPEAGQAAEDVEVTEPQEEEPEEVPELQPVTVSRFEDSDEEEDDVDRLIASVLGSEPSEGGLIEVINQDKDSGIMVVKVAGHLDSSSAGELEVFLESVHEMGFSKVVVDLSDVPYISSGGWGIFTGRVKMLREKEGDVVLAGMSPEVFDIYELLGFQDIIMHFLNTDEAVDFISLPFEVRQERLELVSGSVSEGKRLEQRISAVAEQEAVELEEGVDPWSPLQIEAGTVGESGEITVLNLVGVIDTVSCMKLRDVLDKLIKKGVHKFVVDMSLVEYVSSAGWGVFASRIDDVRSGEGDIKIFGMDPEVDSIFHLLGFDVIMRSFSILAEAIEDFGKDRGTAPPPGEKTAYKREQKIEPEPGADKTSGETVPAPARPAPGADMSRLEFEVEAKTSPDGRSMVLNVSGAIDAATSAVFHDRLDFAARERPLFMVIDLSGVIYISSSGWGVIVRYMQRLGEKGGRLALSGMTQPIFKIFRDLGFEPLIPHFMSSDAALAGLAAPAADSPVAEPVIEQGPEPVQEPAIGPDEGESGKEESRVDSFRSEPLPERPTGPVLNRSGIEPVIPGKREPAEEIEVELDLTGKGGKGQDKDGRIRKLGWGEYGRKLFERNDKRKEKKKK